MIAALAYYNLSHEEKMESRSNQPAMQAEDVNLYEYPLISLNTDDSSQLTFGDLHGNVIKLIYFLIKENVLGISEADYYALIGIYNLSPEALTKRDIDTFTRILDAARVINRPTIRLIGDVMADRGKNDYLTLIVLKKLSGLRKEILLSNHDIAFIKTFSDGFKVYEDLQGRREFDVKGIIPGYQSPSLHNLARLIKSGKIIKKRIEPRNNNSELVFVEHEIDNLSGFVTRDELNDLVLNHYIPALRLVSYTVDRSLKTVTFYSHAVTGLRTIKALASFLNVFYGDRDAEELALTVERINHVFSVDPLSICNDALNKMKECKLDGKNLKDSEHPIISVMWRRSPQIKYEAEAPAEPPLKLWEQFIKKKKTHGKNATYQELEMPAQSGMAALYYVHGHDGAGQSIAPHVINLDNDLGKEYNTQSKYTILHTHDVQLKDLYHELFQKLRRQVSASQLELDQVANGQSNAFDKIIKEIDRVLTAISIGKVDGIREQLCMLENKFSEIQAVNEIKFKYADLLKRLINISRQLNQVNHLPPNDQLNYQHALAEINHGLRFFEMQLSVQTTMPQKMINHGYQTLFNMRNDEDLSKQALPEKQKNLTF